jgi:hypothetical protein
MRRVGHVPQLERKGAYRILVGKREGKRQAGIPRRRWEDILQWGFKKGARMHGLD